MHAAERALHAGRRAAPTTRGVFRRVVEAADALQGGLVLVVAEGTAATRVQSAGVLACSDGATASRRCWQRLSWPSDARARGGVAAARKGGARLTVPKRARAQGLERQAAAHLRGQTREARGRDERGWRPSMSADGGA